jgi:hypothetical protein
MITSFMPAILPEPAAAGAEKFSMPLPAGASPEDVQHRFDLGTIAELPAPVANFDDIIDAAAQYRRASRSENTRRAYRSAVARFTARASSAGSRAGAGHLADRVDRYAGVERRRVEFLMSP